MKNLAQYKIVVLQVIAALAFSSGIQAARVNVGLQLGALSPNDALVKDTFSGDFYYQGLLGLKDPDSGFEIRGTLGHYSNLSHHPADVGRGFKLSVTPLTASVLYHFTTGPSVIQPYVGAGVGAFFYDGSEDVSGRLFSGTKWGTQLMLGAKFTVMPSVHVVGEYIKSFVPQLVFDNAANFNHDIFTLGIGFSLAPQNRQFEPPPPPQSPAIQQDSLSAEIDQLTVDLKKMTDTQDKLQAQIDAFYTSDSGDERVGILAAVDSKTALTGSEFTIISPGSSQTLVNGIIETIDSAGPVIQIGLKNDQGWRMSVAITRAPFSVEIGGSRYSEFSAENANRYITATIPRTDAKFAQELRKINYLQQRLQTLNAQILAARQQLTALRQLRQAENTPQPSRQSAGSNSSSVIIIDDRYSTPVYSRPIPYWRGFRHEDYTPPPIIINTPPTAEERAKYIEEKRERIQEIRSRTKR